MAFTRIDLSCLSLSRQAKRYLFRGFAGCVEIRTRHNGVKVGVYKADQADLCTEGGPWVTMCEAHRNLVNHQTLREAMAAARHPEVWCPNCQGELS